MPSVTLIKPVTHDGEDLVAGDTIADLTEKEAARLVRLGAATLGVAAKVEQAGGEGGNKSDPGGGLDGGGEDAIIPDGDAQDGLSAEEAAEIEAMKKPDLVAKLKEAEVELTGKETVPQLKELLKKAWSAPFPGTGGGD